MNHRALTTLLCLSVFAASAPAQWNPIVGQWGKSTSTDLRIMTWNVHDDICSTASKVDGANTWTSAARIVAAMRPDVLILQECADNNGNGTGTTMDTIAQLTSAINMFLHGGLDTFHASSPITSWVQKYAPGYDLPYVFVSAANDNFNRNVILSRYPFADLNGDGVSTLSDFSISADAYAPGGTGGIRGFSFAEIDLPNAIYAGDLVMGNSHLKSGGQASDLAQRLTAAQNITYFIDYFFNGAGTGIPDPNHKVLTNIHPTSILPANTPFITGGDLNESIDVELRRGPAQWMTQAAVQGGTDGCDRNRSDSTYDDARDFFTNSPITQQSGYKDDYLLWQDSIAAPRRIWIFNTASLNAQSMPPELTGYSGGGSLASQHASDHRPVVADFIMPLTPPPPACPGDINADHLRDTTDLTILLGVFGTSVTPGTSGDLNNDGTVNTADLTGLLAVFGVPCP